MKATPENLIEEIKDDFHIFLKYGNIAPLSKKIDPHMRINDFETLLRIHFVLSEDVVSFIEKLSERLRRIKTTVKLDAVDYLGEVRGRVNWRETNKRRTRDAMIYTCDFQERDFQINENMVLTKLLNLIDDILNNDLSFAFVQRYPWVSCWLEGIDLKKHLTRLLTKNVYLKKIDQVAGLKSNKVTPRMLKRTAMSRNSLYRDAANLLIKYNKLLRRDLDKDEVKNLLKNTFIKPGKEEVLFELYWIMKILKKIEDKVEYNLIKPFETGPVASWKDSEYRVALYHDSNGSLSFKEKLNGQNRPWKDKDNYFARLYKAIEKLNSILEGYETDTLWGGRPDILIEKRDSDGKIVTVFIGEVKYTDDKNYAIKGLKELLEYSVLAKYKDEYFEKIKNLFTKNNIKCCLFIDNIQDFNIKADDNVKLLKYGEEFNVKDIIC